MYMSNEHAHLLLKNLSHLFSWGKCEDKVDGTEAPSQHREIKGAKQHMADLPVWWLFCFMLTIKTEPFNL